MSAHASKSFNHGFILDEAGFRKISEIIHKRFETLSPNDSIKIRYKAYRSDSMVYETRAADFVLNEENSTRNKITKLQFLADLDDQLRLQLTFDVTEEAKLQIEGQERDTVYLMLSDLREYLDTEVCRYRVIKSTAPLKKYDGMLIPIVAAIVLPFIVYLTGHPVSKTTTDKLKQSGDIQQKLNYLIDRFAAQDTIGNGIYLLPVGLFAVIGIWVLLNLYFKTLFPSNLFVWGKELDRYSKVLNVRDKINWGLLIASVLGVLTSVVGYYITKGR